MISPNVEESYNNSNNIYNYYYYFLWVSKEDQKYRLRSIRIWTKKKKKILQGKLFPDTKC